MSSDPFKAAGLPGNDATDIDVSSMQQKGMNMDAGEYHMPWHCHLLGIMANASCGQPRAQLKLPAYSSQPAYSFLLQD